MLFSRLQNVSAIIFFIKLRMNFLCSIFLRGISKQLLFLICYFLKFILICDIYLFVKSNNLVTLKHDMKNVQKITKIPLLENYSRVS